MQIPHRIVVAFLVGVTLGIGCTIVVEKLLDQRLAQSRKPQARPIPALTGSLLLQGGTNVGTRQRATHHRGIQ